MPGREMLLLLAVMAAVPRPLDATDVCSSTILPGSKGDDGGVGDAGEQGGVGKTGASGLPGLPGESGGGGDRGRPGKMAPMGEKGEKGDTGEKGPPGLKGTTCDCGRYRKVVGQLDLNIKRLRNAVKFVKNVILGIRETDEVLFLLVKEARRNAEALMNCRLRGGSLATPKSGPTNQLLADYVNQAGLTRVFIGLQSQSGGGAYEAWSQKDEPIVAPPTNVSCVELQSTGTWGRVSCDVTMFYICQFPKSRRRGVVAARV